MEERYPGERRGLRLFLEGLIGAVEEHLGRDALLYHRIRLAVERGDLASLRAARQMFNHQDTALKRRLSLARQGDGGRRAVTVRHLALAGSSEPSERDRQSGGASVLAMPPRDPAS